MSFGRGSIETKGSPVGKQGRYGKYGEQKRIARLRDSGVRNMIPKQKDSPQLTSHRLSRKSGGPGTEILIEPADASDAGFIQSLSETVFSPYGPYARLLSEWFLTGLMLTLKAVKKKRPEGFVMLGIIENKPDESRVAELVAVAVEPGWQRMGIGNRLVAAALKTAEERFVEKVILHTAVDNLPAQALFEKQGFIFSCRKENFYPNGQGALMMARSLRTAQGDQTGLPM